MDRLHYISNGQISGIDQRGIQSNLSPIGIGIEIALRTGIAAAVLIIALIWGNEREIRNMAGSEIFKHAIRPLKSHRIVQAAVAIVALLNITKIGERIVLNGIKVN